MQNVFRPSRPRGPMSPYDVTEETEEMEQLEAPAMAPTEAPAIAPPAGGPAVYVSRRRWTPEEPKSLVIACSDGRIDGQLDDFVRDHLRLTNYDRVYVPGGPGGLAGNSSEYMRADQLRRECTFLIEAHKVEEVVLVFHGAADGGPDAAVCGDYRRRYASESPQDLNRLQEADLVEALRTSFPSGVRTRSFRAEVTSDNTVRFVSLDR